MINSTFGSMNKFLRGIGRRMIERIWRLGAGARLFFLTLIYSGESFKRFNLTLREIYFTGVMSLLIIIVSAFFVGMVLGCRVTIHCKNMAHPRPLVFW